MRLEQSRADWKGDREQGKNREDRQRAIIQRTLAEGMGLLCRAHEANRFQQARHRRSPTTAEMRFGRPGDNVVDRSRFGNIASDTNSMQRPGFRKSELRFALL